MHQMWPPDYCAWKKCNVKGRYLKHVQAKHGIQCREATGNLALAVGASCAKQVSLNGNSLRKENIQNSIAIDTLHG